MLYRTEIKAKPSFSLCQYLKHATSNTGILIHICISEFILHFSFIYWYFEFNRLAI